MQIDSVPELPPSGCYENIATSMDVFSCYLFAYPTSKQDAKTIAKVLTNIMTKHAYLLTTLISDRVKTCMSHVIREVACVLGITLKHATTKRAQINGLPERCYAAIKQTLRFETGERRNLWHKYVSIAIVNYTTTSHASFGCEASRVFPGLTAYNILDLEISIRPQKFPSPESQMAQDELEQTERIVQDVRKNAMQAYIGHKAYYYKKNKCLKTQTST